MKINMNVWIDDSVKSRIQHWVDKGQFKSPSEFAREAFNNHLYYLYVTESKSRSYVKDKTKLRN